MTDNLSLEGGGMASRGSGRWSLASAALAFAMCAAVPTTLLGQDEDELGWFYTAEVSAVMTGGNAVATTLGFGGTIKAIWENAALDIRGGGLRTSTGTITRTAVGTTSDFDVTRNTNRETTAENYFLRGRINRTITEQFFYYGGAGWERNTFAGFNARVVAEAGAGNVWANSDATRFKTNYGLTYTVQDDVVENPDVSDSFAGLRVSGDFWKQLTATTAFESLVTLDQSFSRWEAFRADWTNAVSVDISDALALKAGLQLLFNNEPSLTTVGLEQPAGTPTGETVLVPLEKLDTVFTIALVADF
jgi:hypothetical protein